MKTMLKNAQRKMAMFTTIITIKPGAEYTKTTIFYQFVTVHTHKFI